MTISYMLFNLIPTLQNLFYDIFLLVLLNKAIVTVFTFQPELVSSSFIYPFFFFLIHVFVVVNDIGFFRILFISLLWLFKLP